MKATGIVRKVDELGRIVLPIELRRTLNIEIRDPLEIYVDGESIMLKKDREKMEGNLHNSLMLVTALNPYIGYENAAKVAKKAYAEGISLKESCVALGFLSSEEFDKVFHPEKMV